MNFLNPENYKENRILKYLIFFLGGLGGVFTGYLSKLIELHSAIAENLIRVKLQHYIGASITKIQGFLEWLILFTPNLGFLSDIVAAQSAIIAIAIPLSLDIVSRISERYQSGVITREFNKQWEIKALRRLVVINLVMAIALKFFIADTSSTSHSKVLIWITFLLFVFTTGILLIFFDSLQKYTTDTKFLLDRLFKDINDTLEVTTFYSKKIRPKKLKLKQQQFIDSIHGIGDILVFETRNKKSNEYIKKGLSRMQEKVKRFLDIQKNDPELFEQMLLSQDFFELSKKDRRAAQLSLLFLPENYLTSLTTVTNQISRIRETAIEVGNIGIARQTTSHLLLILKGICEVPGNDIPVEYLIHYIADFRRMNNNDELIYDISIGWYMNTVFDKSFDISYLCLFNRYFILFIQDVISNNRTNVFQVLVRTLEGADGIQQQDYAVTQELERLLRYPYQNFIELNRTREISKRLSQLRKQIWNIFTKTQQDNCLELIKTIGESVITYPDSSHREKIKNELSKLEGVCKFSYKLNSLLALMFSVGAYCLSKKQPNYIKQMWNFKQTQDVGIISPNTIVELIDFNFYFRASPFEWSRSISWDDHYVDESYYRQYFLLILLRKSQKSQTTLNLQFLKNLSSSYLKNIANEFDGLIPVARQLKKELDSFKVLEFDYAKSCSNIQNNLIPFLESCKAEIQKQIQKNILLTNVSQKKLEEFRIDFLQEFNRVIVLRNILRNYGLYNEKAAENNTEIIPMEIVDLQNKTIFFDDWIGQSAYGKIYGSMFAEKEDTYVITKLIKVSKKLSIKHLADFLADLKDISSWFIIAFDSFLDGLSENDQSFEYTQGTETEFLIGFYTFKDIKIPVFQFFCSQSCPASAIPNNAALFLKKTALGCFSQYVPEEGDENQRIASFSISVQILSEDLVNKILANPPKWLVQEGNQDQQRKILERKVKIRIFERLSLDIQPDFQGYLVDLPIPDGDVFNLLS